MTKKEISEWLSAERRWNACIKWIHAQGRRVSKMTLTRALDNDTPTPRQKLAIAFAQQYITLCEGVPHTEDIAATPVAA